MTFTVYNNDPFDASLAGYNKAMTLLDKASVMVEHEENENALQVAKKALDLVTGHTKEDNQLRGKLLYEIFLANQGEGDTSALISAGESALEFLGSKVDSTIRKSIKSGIRTAKKASIKRDSDSVSTVNGSRKKRRKAISADETAAQHPDDVARDCLDKAKQSMKSKEYQKAVEHAEDGLINAKEGSELSFKLYGIIFKALYFVGDYPTARARAILLLETETYIDMTKEEKLTTFIKLCTNAYNQLLAKSKTEAVANTIGDSEVVASISSNHENLVPLVCNWRQR